MNELFLQLVRLGIGTSKDAKIPNNVDWQVVKDLAEKQGLSAIVLDGIEEVRCKKEDGRCDVVMPSQEIMLQWIGETLQDYDNRYDAYKKAIAEMAGFYNAHGYKMMILKGYACSFDWPKPEHRPCGDIDIWLFGKQKEADRLLEKAITDRTNKKDHFTIDTSHHHHTVFNWGEFTVENHYDFINVYHHQSHARLERIFKELGKDDSHVIEVDGEKIYLPSPNLHALFLLKHTMLHFVSGEINLRQIIDWGFFVKKHGKDVDWKWLMDLLDEYGMTPAFNIFNAICVEDLGFEASIFPQVQFRPMVKERALNEILHTESTNNSPKALFPKLLYRYRRWKASEWKHELCYRESMTSAFWHGVWGHLLKPKSI